MKRTNVEELNASSKRHKPNSLNGMEQTQKTNQVYDWQKKVIFMLDTNTANGKLMIYIKVPNLQYTPYIATDIKNKLLNTKLHCPAINGFLCIGLRTYSEYMSAKEMFETVNEVLGPVTWSTDASLIKEERIKRKLNAVTIHPWPCTVTYVLDDENPKDPKVYLLMDTDNDKEKDQIYSILVQSATAMQGKTYTPVAGGLKNTELELVSKKYLYTLQLKDDRCLPQGKTIVDLVNKYVRQVKGGEWDNRAELVQVERQKRQAKWRDNKQNWNDKVQFIYDQAENVVYLKIVNEAPDEFRYVYDLIQKRFRALDLPLKINSIHGKCQISPAKEDDNTNILEILKRVYWQRGKFIENPTESELEEVKNASNKHPSSKTIPKHAKTSRFDNTFNWQKEVTFILDVIDSHNKKIPVVYVKVNDNENNKLNYAYGALRDFFKREKLLSCEMSRTEENTILLIRFKNPAEKQTRAQLKQAITDHINTDNWVDSSDAELLNQFRENIQLFGNVLDHRWRNTNRSWKDMVVYTLDNEAEDGPWVYVTVRSNNQDDVLYAYASFKQTSYPNSDTQTHHGSLHNTVLDCQMVGKYITIGLRPGAMLPRRKSMMDLVNQFVFGGSWDNDQRTINTERTKRLDSWKGSDLFWKDKIAYIIDDFNPDDPAIYLQIKNKEIGDLGYVRWTLSRKLKGTILEFECNGPNITLWVREGEEIPSDSTIQDVVNSLLPRSQFIENDSVKLQERALRIPFRFKRWLSSRSTVTWDDMVTYTFDNTNSKKPCVYVTINGHSRDFDYAHQQFQRLFNKTNINFMLVYGYFILTKKNTTKKSNRSIDKLVQDAMQYIGGKWDNSEFKVQQIHSIVSKRMSAERLSRYPHSQQKKKLIINWNEVVFNIVTDNPKRPYILIDSTNAENETRIMNALSYDLTSCPKLYVGKVGSLKKGDSGKMAIKLCKNMELAEGETIQELAEKYIRGGFYDQNANVLCVLNWRYIQYTKINEEEPAVKVTQCYHKLKKRDHRLRQDMKRICAALNHDLKRTVLNAELTESKELLIKVKPDSELPKDETIETIMTKFVRGGHWLISGVKVQVWNGPRTPFETPREELSEILNETTSPMESESPSQSDTMQVESQTHNVSLGKTRYSFLRNARTSETYPNNMEIDNNNNQFTYPN